MNNKEIDSIAYLINQARKNNEPKPIVFLGAGASISAGIPGTAQIIQDILTEFADKPEIKRLDIVERNYYSLMSCLNTEERHKLLRSYITSEEVKINVSHIYLAQMVKEGYIDYVLTVNFDDLFLKACAMFNFIPPVYDISILKDFTTTTLSEGSITYLHGQYHGFWLLNTGEELNKVKEYIPTVLDRICNRRTWIIVGYSGEDSIFSHIERLEHFTNELFWVGYNNNPPGENVRQRLLEKANSNASWISGYDADSFFLKLHSELKMNTPDIFNKPFSFLKGLMSNIRDASTDLSDGEHKNLFEHVKERFDIALQQTDDAIQRYEKNDSSKSLSPEDIINNQLKQQIIEAIVKGNYKNTEELKEKAKYSNQEIKGLLSRLYFNWGITLYEAGKKTAVAATLEDAIKKFIEAASLDDSDSSIYLNWGAAVRELSPDDSNPDIINEAMKIYQKGIGINPKNGELFYNYGNAFSHLGKIKKTESYYHEAIKKLEKAVELNVKDKIAYVAWGNALSNLAKMKKSQSSAREAINKYERAIQIDNKYGPAYHNLSNIYIIISKLLQRDLSDFSLNKAVEVAQKAVELGESPYNLACAYALLNQREKALSILEQALEKKDYFWKKDPLSTEDVLNDEDWEKYHQDDEFLTIIKKHVQSKRI